MTTLPPLTPLAAMRWSFVRQVLDELRPKSILEVGCGAGAVGARLAARADYLGLEPDSESFAIATSRIETRGGQVRNGSIDTVEDGEAFDLVCAFEVIEHLANDAATLERWGQLLGKGGHILLSTPAGPDRFGPWDTMVGHYRRYSPLQFEILLQEAGFVDVEVRLYGWPLGYATEAVRNRLARRRIGVIQTGPAATMQERTAGSARHLQPTRMEGVLLRAFVAPFVALQHRRPSRGIGLIALAKRA